MDVFTEDSDLETLRPDILSTGLDSFDDQHEESFRIIVRELKLWQRQSAITRISESSYVGSGSLEELAGSSYPFNLDYFLAWETEIKPAAIRLTLSLAYVAMAKDLPADEDGLAYQATVFRTAYDEEWALAVRSGFSYDWDASGIITPGESVIQYRTLRRQ